MSDVRREIADVVRGRILRGLQAGVLRLGDRLPSARELEAEFGVDHRQVLDAYRLLVDEELVELRPRGGIYVADSGARGGVPLPSEVWLSTVLAEGISREIPLPELHDWLRRAVETRRLRAVVVEVTDDQIAGLCRELREDYGLEATGVPLDDLRGDDVPSDLRYSDVIVTTPSLVDELRPLAERLSKRLIAAEIRMDLIGGEWRLLLRQDVYVVVRDERFAEKIREFFAEVPGADRMHMLVVGRDDLATIPPTAPVYVTRSARERLGDVQIAGRLLPTARLLSGASSQEIVRFIVTENLRAIAGMRR